MHALLGWSMLLAAPHLHFWNALQRLRTNLLHLLPPSQYYRLLKEVAYYQQEVKDNEIKLEEMKSSNKDPYDIKQFEKVLQESYMMVPDSERRLKQALEDLSSFVDDSGSESAIDKTGEWYTTADKILNEHYSGKSGDEEVAETNVDELAEGEAF